MPQIKQPDYVRRRLAREIQERELEIASQDAQGRYDTIKAVEALTAEVTRYRADQDTSERKRLSTDRITALAACVAATLSLGSLIAFICLSLVANGTANKAVAMAGHQADEMRNQRRAWMNVNDPQPDTDLHRGNDGLVHLILKMAASNTGLSPARFGYLWAKMFARGPAAVELAEIWAKCDQIRRRPINSRTEGETFFPGQSTPQRYGLVLSSADEKKLHSGNGSTLMVAGCFDYLLSDQLDHHQTSFVYELDRSDTANGVPTLNTIDPTRDLPIPGEHLEFEINPGLANNAD